MEDKGKTINIETYDEEEDLHTFVKEIEPDKEVEEDIHPMCTISKLPKYVPPWKGKAKIPKDLEATKSTLQTPLLPNGIRFEGSSLGRIPTMKFKDWDLADSE